MPSRYVHNEADDEQYQEDEEKHFGNTDCCCRYSQKSKDARNDGDDKKCYGPVKHKTLLLLTFFNPFYRLVLNREQDFTNTC